MMKGKNNRTKLASFDIDDNAQKYSNKSSSLCSVPFLRKALKTLLLILLYYLFSITLTFYNKKFIKEFRMPLSITMFHLTTKFIMAVFVRWLIYAITGKPRTMLNWKLYCTKVGPPGLFTSLDIALSNWSLEFITISLYTMTKSTVIVFILFFAIMFRIEKMRCSLVFVVLFIATGLFLFTYQSTQFNMEGFLMVMSASVFSGLRWALSQLVLQKHEIGLSNPLDMMYHIQPWMIVALFPLSIAFEGLFMATSSQTLGYREGIVLWRNVGILLIGAAIAFCMEFAEFLLVSETSSLTLSISGIVKEIATLILATQINHDEFSTLNVIGLSVCLCGITLHVVLKAIRQAGAEETALSAEYSELLADDSDEVEEDLDEIIRAADSDVSARRSVQQLR